MALRRKVRPRPGAAGRKKGPPQAIAAKLKRAARDDDSSDDGSETGSSGSRTSDDESSTSGPSDEDDPREYKHGGYHPVSPYQLYHSRYRVLSKLGAGAFSTVWLCADEKETTPEGPQLVAMKVCKSKKSVTEQALDEIELLERLDNSKTSSPHVVQMRGHFWHSGPNGRHKAMVFEVMGENLLALVKHYDYDGLPIKMVKRIARHTLRGLAYIHSRGVIHTDVKLENVLVQRHDMAEMMKEARRAFRAYMDTRANFEGMSKSQKKRAKKKEKQKNAQAKLDGEEKEEDASKKAEPQAEASPTDSPADGATAVEEGGPEADPDEAAAQACGRPVPPVRQRERFDTFGLEQCFAKLADFGNGVRSNRKVTDDIQTRQYRSPEVIIGQEWNETADNWSAACMFFELVTGDFLFDPHTGDDWSRDEDHLALMIELLGDHPPKDWVTSGKWSRDFFNNNGKLKHIKSLKFWPLTDVLTEKYSLEKEDASELADFLLPMLRWLPSDRQQASEALQHRWVQPSDGEVDFPPRTSSQQQDETPAKTADVGDTAPTATPALAKETTDACGGKVSDQVGQGEADTKESGDTKNGVSAKPSALLEKEAAPKEVEATEERCNGEGGAVEDDGKDDEDGEGDETGPGDSAKAKKKKNKGKKKNK